MQDVADRAGVSRTTASFVLNGRDEMRISDAAAERVRRAARELDYRPNVAARSLSRPLARAIALLSDGVTTDATSGDLIAGCLTAAIDSDHMLLMGECRGDQGLRDQFVRDFLQRQVDGIVLASTFHELVEVSDVVRQRPVVLLNATVADESVPAVVLDDVQGATALVDHLVDLGHRDGIWVLGELPGDLVGAVERERGIRGALAGHGLSLGGVLPCKWWPESARDELADHLAGGGPVPTALVCLNDRVALGAYQALATLGLDVPGDVSVVSFDDSPLAAWLQPGLTSVAIPHAQLGRTAIELVVAGAREPGVHRIPMPLRVRGSSGPPRRRG